MKFSIITVCYNSEKTIRRTFDSVLDQTCPDYEYIVIDGASKDGTVEIIKEYEPKFNGRMRWVSEPDKGIYDAMNKGISMARGDVIGIINSDDYYEKEALQTLLPALETPADVYYGMVRLLDDSGKERFTGRTSHHFLKEQVMYHPGCFVARKAYEKFGLFKLQYRIAADYDLLSRFYDKEAVFLPVDGVFAAFSPGGASAGGPEYEMYKVKLHHGYISKLVYTRRIAGLFWGYHVNRLFREPLKAVLRFFLKGQL